MPSTLEQSRVHDAEIRRVLGEYLEMPGLSPTFAQARRLFGLDDRTCRAVLDMLVRTRFLSRDDTGRYVRSDLAWRGSGPAGVPRRHRPRSRPSAVP